MDRGSQVAPWSLDFISSKSRDNGRRQLTDGNASKVALKGDATRDLCRTKSRVSLVDMRGT